MPPDFVVVAVPYACVCYYHPSIHKGHVYSNHDRCNAVDPTPACVTRS